MARVSKANESQQGEKEEYKLASRRARAARADVGAQIEWAVVHQDLTGSPNLLGMRVKQWLEAEKEGDPFVVRAAAAELAAAAGAYMVHLDLTAPALRRSEPARADSG